LAAKIYGRSRPIPVYESAVKLSPLNAMKRPISTRSDFSYAVKTALAKRSGYRCAICGALTTGPSAKSLMSSTNIGVAAHITAASSKGPRYDPSLTSDARASITNGIWLCQNHAKLIDDDCASWPVSKLRDIQRRHVTYVGKLVGVPQQGVIESSKKVSAAREWAFVFVRELAGAYREFLGPLLRDRKLTGDTELGVLMCGSPPEETRTRNPQATWTVFVNAEWLRWILTGQSGGFRLPSEIPPEQIYGQIPGWPDGFFEFLKAMVQTGTTFEWQRSAKGFLVLAQQSNEKRNRLTNPGK
jgi:hypothetical protein